MASNEQSIIAARASVMVYDDTNKKWIPSGTSSGVSRVHIYQNTLNNTFRVVGRKLQDHELVINYAIQKGLKYNTATATFHNWRDSRQVYGLNFSSKEDAHNFAETITQVLDLLNTSSSPSSQNSGLLCTLPPQSIVPNMSIPTMINNSNNNMINHATQQQQQQQQQPIPQPVKAPPPQPSQQQAQLPPQPLYGHTGCPQSEVYSEVWNVTGGGPPGVGPNSNHSSTHNSNWTNNDMNEWKQAQINEMNNINHQQHLNHSNNAPNNPNMNHIMSNIPVPPSQATYGHHKPPSSAPNNPGMINLSQPGQVQSSNQTGQASQAIYSTR